jgi:hypothetical protein
MAHSATEELRSCLRRIASLLEKGEPVAAAAIVGEMNEIFPRLPPDMPQDELAEASQLLDRCKELELGLREKALVALRQLGATRRSMIYRRYGSGP